MSISNSNLSNLFKKLYPEKRVAEAVFKKHPLLGIIEKQLAMGSDGTQVLPIILGDYDGRSATFSEALSGAASGYIPNAAFTLSIPNNFAVGTVDHRTVIATSNTDIAFVKAVETAMERSLNAMRVDLARSLFLDGNGIIGAISVVASQVITFADRLAVRTLNLGSRLFCYSDSAFGTQRATTAVVTHIDRELGKITVTGNITAWVAGDVVTHAGDAGAKLKGLAAWIPSTAPTSGDNFFGVDRSVDAVRLAGHRIDGTNKMLQDVIIDAEAQIHELSDSFPSLCVMSPRTYAQLAKEVKDRSTVWGTTGMVKIGYTGLQIAAGGGYIDVITDANCPADRMYLLTKEDVKFYCLGRPQLINTWNNDGFEVIRDASANSMSFRIYSYAQLGFRRLDNQAVILL